MHISIPPSQPASSCSTSSAYRLSIQLQSYVLQATTPWTPLSPIRQAFTNTAPHPILAVPQQDVFLGHSDSALELVQRTELLD